MCGNGVVRAASRGGDGKLSVNNALKKDECVRDCVLDSQTVTVYIARMHEDECEGAGDEVHSM